MFKSLLKPSKVMAEYTKAKIEDLKANPSLHHKRRIELTGHPIASTCLSTSVLGIPILNELSFLLTEDNKHVHVSDTYVMGAGSDLATAMTMLRAAETLHKDIVVRGRYRRSLSGSGYLQPSAIYFEDMEAIF